MIRIKWIAPEDRPELSKDTEGEASGSTITLFRGRATGLTEEHERAHIVLGHTRKLGVTPFGLARREIEANLYTYKKLGKPRRLIMELRGIIADILDSWREIKEPREALSIVESVFAKKSRDIPSTWKKDLERLRLEFR